MCRKRRRNKDRALGPRVIESTNETQTFGAFLELGSRFMNKFTMRNSCPVSLAGWAEVVSEVVLAWKTIFAHFKIHKRCLSRNDLKRT